MPEKNEKIIPLTEEQVGKSSPKDPNKLVGSKFRRNKYGPSFWTDTIKKVFLNYTLVDENTKRVELVVLGHLSDNEFPISEIELLDEPLNLFEKLRLDKRNMHQRISEEYKKQQNEKNNQQL